MKTLIYVIFTAFSVVEAQASLPRNVPSVEERGETALQAMQIFHISLHFISFKLYLRH